MFHALALRRPLLVLMASLAFLGGIRAEPESPRLVVQVGHAAGVSCVSFSRDGQLLATGDVAGVNILLWHLPTGRELRRFRTATHVVAVALTPSGRLLAAADQDGRVCLFDVATDRPVGAFTADPGRAPALAVSEDGAVVVTVKDKNARVWDTRGKPLRTLTAVGDIRWVVLSPDGGTLLAGTRDRLHCWDLATGTVLWNDQGDRAMFSPDGHAVLVAGKDCCLRDRRSGAEVRRFEVPGPPAPGRPPAPKEPEPLIAFSPDGKRVLTLTRPTAEVLQWDAGTGRLLSRCPCKFEHLFAAGHWGREAVLASDGRALCVAGPIDSTNKFWTSAVVLDPDTGATLRKIEADSVPILRASFSASGKRLSLGRWPDNKLRTWNCDNGYPESIPKSASARKLFSVGGEAVLCRNPDGSLEVLRGRDKAMVFRIPDEGDLASLAPGGHLLVLGGRNGRLSVADVSTGLEKFALAGHQGRVTALAFSADGAALLTSGADRTVRLWNLKTGGEIRRLPDQVEGIHDIALSPDGKWALIARRSDTRIVVSVWDCTTGKRLREYCPGEWPRGLKAVQMLYSPDGTYALLRTEDRLYQWDPRTSEALRTIAIEPDHACGFTISPDGRVIVTTSMNGTVLFLDAATGKEQCRLVDFLDGSWAVVDPAGRYDASNGGDVEGLHWVVGLEPIALKQLKERYYEPGLLAKHLGFNKEPLRNVAVFRAVPLYPDLAVAQPDPSKPRLVATLTNRGGGIGRVVVLVNGKELTADARTPGADPQAPRIAIPVDLTGDPRLEAGKPNTVEVLAYNADGYLSSRGMQLFIQGPGAADAGPPRLWAVVVGVSEYRGGKLNLRYASKDAEDFAAALRVASVRLFGADNVQLTLLSSAQPELCRRPTRDNLVRALEAIKGKARPGDVVVVYLAGHGVLSGGEGGEFYYLTADAGSADLTDPEVRARASLSSQELTDLLKAVPARKQVLILDTCASGRVVDKLTEKRDVPGSQVRALDRLKDRSGVHVLAGCASDAVSYETSRYGQGVLTYSLLLGMRGGKLREGEYVDIVDLFGFAADEVPVLARDIGGVQRPVIASPRGTNSFDIGRVTPEDQARIRLQPALPLVIRSSLQEADEFADVLGLGRRLDDRLRGASLRGRDARLVFVDAVEFPDAYQLAGRYKAEGDLVTVTVNVFRGKEKVGQLRATGPKDKPDEVADQLVVEVEKWLHRTAAH